jgi:translocator protein
MLILLASLIVIYLRLKNGVSLPPAGEHWLVQLPFSIYLGWITVATIANVTVLLEYLGWNGFGIGEEVWFVIMLVVALAVAALVAWTRGDVAYLLVLAWAFAGIGVKHGDNAVVSSASWAATVVVLALVGMSILRRRQGQPPVVVTA